MKKKRCTPYQWTTFPVGAPLFSSGFVVLDKLHDMRPYAFVAMSGKDLYVGYEWREELLKAPLEHHWHQFAPVFLFDEKRVRTAFEWQYEYFASRPDHFKIVRGGLFSMSEEPYNLNEVKEAFRVGLYGHGNNEW